MIYGAELLGAELGWECGFWALSLVGGAVFGG